MSMINLLPLDYQQRRGRRRANVLCLVLFVVVMTGVMVAAWVSEHNAEALSMANEELSQEYRQAAESITEIRQLEARKKQVIAKARIAGDLVERVPRSYLLACLTNALPEGGSLSKVALRTTAIRTAAPAAATPKFSTRGARRTTAAKDDPPEAIRPRLKVSLEVTGLARTDLEVAEFITNIQSNPLLRAVELVYSTQEEVGGVVLRKFQVTMELADNAEVEADEAQLASAPSPDGRSRR